jgi:hypothetical protein
VHHFPHYYVYTRAPFLYTHAHLFTHTHTQVGVDKLQGDLRFRDMYSNKHVVDKLDEAKYYLFSVVLLKKLAGTKNQCVHVCESVCVCLWGCGDGWLSVFCV